MWEFLRKIPTPTYGRCGGAAEDCSDKPLDPMDIAFKEHDQNLYQTEKLPEGERKIARLEADHILRQELLKIEPKTLTLYGRLYRWSCLQIFK